MLSRLPQILQDKIEPEPNSGCWLWAGPCTDSGYGEVWLDGRRTRAHRYVFGLLRGDASLASAETLDHLCRVRACVNPAHLEPVSKGENVLRGVGLSAENARKDRCPFGHPFDRVDNRGQRCCRRCMAAACRRWQAKRRARV